MDHDVLLSAAEVARLLRCRRPRGLRLSRTRFFVTLRQPFYAGLVALPDGTEVEGQWTPVIDKPTFSALQRRLAPQPASKRTYTKANPRFPLKSQVRCACGRPLTSDAGTKGKIPTWREYYTCPTCGPEHVRVRPDDLHAQFVDLLRRLTPAPGFNAGEIRAAMAHRRERVDRELRAERARLAAWSTTSGPRRAATSPRRPAPSPPPWRSALPS